GQPARRLLVGVVAVEGVDAAFEGEEEGLPVGGLGACHGGQRVGGAPARSAQQHALHRLRDRALEPLGVRLHEEPRGGEAGRGHVIGRHVRLPTILDSMPPFCIACITPAWAIAAMDGAALAMAALTVSGRPGDMLMCRCCTTVLPPSWPLGTIVPDWLG